TVRTEGVRWLSRSPTRSAWVNVRSDQPVPPFPAFVYDALPGRVVFGVGSVAQLGEEVDRLGGRRGRGHARTRGPPRAARGGPRPARGPPPAGRGGSGAAGRPASPTSSSTSRSRRPLGRWPRPPPPVPTAWSSWVAGR